LNQLAVIPLSLLMTVVEITS